jgi:hypothetical protein
MLIGPATFDLVTGSKTCRLSSFDMPTYPSPSTGPSVSSPVSVVSPVELVPVLVSPVSPVVVVPPLELLDASPVVEPVLSSVVEPVLSPVVEPLLSPVDEPVLSPVELSPVDPVCDAPPVPLDEPLVVGTSPLVGSTAVVPTPLVLPVDPLELELPEATRPSSPHARSCNEKVEIISIETDVRRMSSAPV